jgi:hypothetical protein
LATLRRLVSELNAKLKKRNVLESSLTISMKKTETKKLFKANLNIKAEWFLACWR